MRRVHSVGHWSLLGCLEGGTHSERGAKGRMKGRVKRKAG